MWCPVFIFSSPESGRIQGAVQRLLEVGLSTRLWPTVRVAKSKLCDLPQSWSECAYVCAISGSEICTRNAAVCPVFDVFWTYLYVYTFYGDETSEGQQVVWRVRGPRVTSATVVRFVIPCRRIWWLCWLISPGKWIPVILYGRQRWFGPRISIWYVEGASSWGWRRTPILKMMRHNKQSHSLLTQSLTVGLLGDAWIPAVLWASGHKVELGIFVKLRRSDTNCRTPGWARSLDCRGAPLILS